MRLGTFTKTVVDNIRFEIDYSEWLDAPEILISSEIGSDPIGLVVSGAAVSNDTSLVFFVAGGTNEEVHNLLITVTTDAGQIRQDYIVVTVSNP